VDAPFCTPDNQERTSLVNTAVRKRADQRTAAGTAVTMQRYRLSINRGQCATFSNGGHTVFVTANQIPLQANP
jgi:hypothetical protein